ncbi:hypothetical protein AVEN_249929-1 [Araneus ventricosus]|uniref:Uncharacterized protein n=1 Tax=Araneus ventricosus TaxID=182803 RepID=A0A4Y2E0U7_ARAVE|nr:hypothetical protein AVEN_249929-1 [Araneus ventricosus]
MLDDRRNFIRRVTLTLNLILCHDAKYKYCLWNPACVLQEEKGWLDAPSQVFGRLRWSNGEVSALGVQGSKPDPTEDPSCIGPVAREANLNLASISIRARTLCPGEGRAVTGFLSCGGSASLSPGSYFLSIRRSGPSDAREEAAKQPSAPQDACWIAFVQRQVMLR